MTSKKVQIGAKPIKKTAQADADKWVENRESVAVVSEAEKMKRLTIDVSVSLHRRMKAACAMRGTNMADEVRSLLLEKYGNT